MHYTNYDSVAASQYIMNEIACPDVMFQRLKLP